MRLALAGRILVFRHHDTTERWSVFFSVTLGNDKFYRNVIMLTIRKWQKEDKETLVRLNAELQEFERNLRPS